MDNNNSNDDDDSSTNLIIMDDVPTESLHTNVSHDIFHRGRHINIPPTWKYNESLYLFQSSSYIPSVIRDNCEFYIVSDRQTAINLMQNNPASKKV